MHSLQEEIVVAGSAVGGARCHVICSAIDTLVNLGFNAFKIISRMAIRGQISVRLIMYVHVLSSAAINLLD
jgi:hypothetical protein